MQHVGVHPHIVRAFRVFYNSLRHCFHYGQVSGLSEAWPKAWPSAIQSARTSSTCCFEAFHRWAADQHVSTKMVGLYIASASFANDVAIVATSCMEVVLLVERLQALV